MKTYTNVVRYFLIFSAFFAFTNIFSQNLIVNPSFNPFVDVAPADGMDDSWSMIGVATTSIPFTGRTDGAGHAQYFQPSAIAPVNLMYQDIVGLNLSKTYDVSFWVKLQAGNFALNNVYYDIIDISSSAIVYSNNTAFAAAAPSPWQNVTFTFNTTTDTDLRIRFGVTDLTAAPVIIFDDISVIEQVAPPAIPPGTLLTNGSFEPPFTTGVADSWSLVGTTSPSPASSATITEGTTSQQIGEGTVTSGYIYQLVTGLTVGQQYTVSFDGRLTAGDFNSFGVEAGIYSPVSGNMIFDDEFLFSALNAWETKTFTFIATETTAQLRFAGGFGVTALLDRAYMLGNDFPVITNVNITGTAEVGYQLTAAVVGYSDTETDLEDAANHEYQWYRADNSTELNIIEISGATSSTYTLTSDDVAKYIFAGVSPAALTGSSPGLEVKSSVPAGPIENNFAPVAANVAISGTEKEGQTLTVTFDISDADTPPNLIGWIVKWYRSSTSAGTSKILLQTTTVAPTLASPQVGNTDTYTLVYDDRNNYIIAEVTPTADLGATPGTAVKGVTSSTIATFIYGKPEDMIPADSDTNIIVQPILAWESNNLTSTTFDQEDQYELQVSTDQLFINVVYHKTDIASAGAGANIANNLDLSTVGVTLNTSFTYYWRVRAKDTGKLPVRYSPWSSIFSFTTTKTAKPSLAFPIGNTSVYTVTPTFYWYMGLYAPGVTYTLDIYTGPAKTGAHVVNQPNIVDKYYKVSSPLSPGTYYWYITAVQGANTKESAQGTFVVSTSAAGNATVPTPSYPFGGLTVYSLTPTLYWYNVTASTGLTYEIQVASDNGFANVVWTSPTTTSTNLYETIGTTLDASTTYYWRVRSYYGITPSAWSTTESFITYTPATSGTVVTPTASWPVGGVTMHSTDVTVFWFIGYYSSGLNYEVDVATDNAFTSIVASYTNVTTLYKQVAGLSAGNTYYWRVRSTNGSSYSAYSGTESFVIESSAIGAVLDPVLIYPSGGLTIFTKDPTLSWLYAGSLANITFEIRYGFYPNGVLASTTTANTTTLALSGLSEGATYYWSVRATDGVNYSAWASDAEFVVAPSATAPVTPNPGSPVAGVTVNDNSPMLSWFIPAEDNGITYELQLSKDPQFSNSMEFTDLKSSSKVVSNLESGSVYNWRVRTKRGDGNYSQFSNYSTFATPGSVTGTEASAEIPTEFFVAQNYPNPFNPSTSISYSIPEAGFVTIKIYNMLGQLVKTLVNTDMNAGVYSIKWNGDDSSGSNVASGTYIYRVESANNVASKKMVLLK